MTQGSKTTEEHSNLSLKDNHNTSMAKLYYNDLDIHLI